MSLLCPIFVVACLSVVWLRFEVWRPFYFDRNSVRQILKEGNLSLYFEKQREYQETLRHLGNLVKTKDVDRTSLEEVLWALDRSPFFENPNDRKQLRALMRVRMDSWDDAWFDNLGKLHEEILVDNE